MKNDEKLLRMKQPKVRKVRKLNQRYTRAYRVYKSVDFLIAQQKSKGKVNIKELV